MELRTELAKENNEILMQDVSLKAILFHFIIKRTGQRTDKAHIAELEKNIKQTSKQPNSLMHCDGSRCSLMLCMHKPLTFPYRKHSTVRQQSINI